MTACMCSRGVRVCSFRWLRSGWLAAVLFTQLAWFGSLSANSVRPLPLAEQLNQSAAVCRGEILANTPFQGEDGHIYTRTTVRVTEVFKGAFPEVVTLTHRGGVLGTVGEYVDASPSFVIGEERLLFLGRQADGTLFAMHGDASATRLLRATAVTPGAGRVAGEAPYLAPHEALLSGLRNATAGGPQRGEDVRDQAGTAPGRTAARVAASHGTLSGHSLFSGRPGRYVQMDRNLPIPYLVDAATLPAGITQPQALQAVENALAAWSAVSSVRFKFEGLQTFGVASPNIPAEDGKLRIQLHDQHNFINSSGTLGQGGVGVNILTLSTGWGTGGNVAGHEFVKVSRGFVVLEHTDGAFNGNPTLLTEILTHEIGHALGLAHSSENPSEPNNTLKEALMYFQAHNDGRGATLGAYDPPIVRQAYPLLNTPPYSVDRVMDVTTQSAGVPNVPTINSVELRGYDLQGTLLTVTNTDSTAGGAGTFTLTTNLLKFAPAGFFGGARLDPASGQAYERTYFRHSDGTNASALAEVKVISLNPDLFPAETSDGVPDAWQQQHFGNANPALVANSGPNADPDNDGFTNLQEYRIGTLPNDFNHKLRMTAVTPTSVVWLAAPFEQYEVRASTNLTTWVTLHPSVVPTTSVGTFTQFTNTAGQMFFRVIKVP